MPARKTLWRLMMIIVPIVSLLVIALVLVPMLLGGASSSWYPWIAVLIVVLFAANYLLTRYWVRFAGRKMRGDEE